MGWSDIGWSDVFKVILTIVVAFTMPELLELIPLITSALNALGINESEEAKVIGDKMLQAEEDGITPDKFDNYEDYNKAIENFELDPEKSNKFTDEEKLQRYAATHLTELKKNFGEGALTYIFDVASKQTKSPIMNERVKTTFESFGNGIDKANSYFKGELSAKEMEITESKLVDIEKKLDPEKTEMEILKQLSKDRTNVQEG